MKECVMCVNYPKVSVKHNITSPQSTMQLVQEDAFREKAGSSAFSLPV